MFIRGDQRNTQPQFPQPYILRFAAIESFVALIGDDHDRYFHRTNMFRHMHANAKSNMAILQENLLKKLECMGLRTSDA